MPRKNPLKSQMVPDGLGKILLAHLIPDAKNPRKDLKKGDPEYEKITKSVEKFGQLDPIVFNTRTRKVLGGHQRLKVLDAKGYTELYTVTLGAYTWAFAEADLKELSPSEETAANIALNKAQGAWNPDQLIINLQELKADGMLEFTGFDEKEFDGMLRELHKDDEPLDTEPQISRAEELRKEWGTEVGQLWQCGSHKIICGDCTDKAVIERLMEKEKPDCLLTDPPYYSGGFQEAGKKSGSIGTRGTEMIANDTLSTRGYIALIKQVLCVTDPAIVYIFTDWRMWVNLFDCVESSGFGVRNMIVWDKGTPGMGRGWRSQHELIMCGTKVSQAFDPHKAQGNVIQCARTGNVNHPTEKNAELLGKILDVTDMANTILDPFLGSGTTMIACENLGRKCRGCEIDPGYIGVILQRYKDTFKVEPVLIE